MQDQNYKGTIHPLQVVQKMLWGLSKKQSPRSRGIAFCGKFKLKKMEEDRVSTDDLTSFHTTFSKKDLVELKEPFIVFQVTKNGNIVWNDITKTELQWFDRLKEDAEYADIKYPEQEIKRVDVWNDLQKKYKNVIPDVEGDCWFYIKL